MKRYPQVLLAVIMACLLSGCENFKDGRFHSGSLKFSIEVPHDWYWNRIEDPGPSASRSFISPDQKFYVKVLAGKREKFREDWQWYIKDWQERMGFRLIEAKDVSLWGYTMKRIDMENPRHPQDHRTVFYLVPVNDMDYTITIGTYFPNDGLDAFPELSVFIENFTIDQPPWWEKRLF